MNSFEFDDRQVRICGNVYSMNFNQPKMSDYADKVETELEKMKDGQKMTKRATDAFRNFIDLILGKGAFDEIFREQEISITALTKLVCFLAGECIAEARVYKNIDFSEIEGLIEASKTQQT